MTEDADLGLRLAREGFGVGDLPSSTHEEAPARLRPWMRQRTRWLKGLMQTCITHTRHPWRTARAMGAAPFACSLALSVGTVLTALFGPAFFGLALHDLARGRLETPGSMAGVAAASFSIVLLLTGLAGILVPAIVGMRRRGLGHLAPWLLLQPFYFALVTLAAWRALAELVRAPQHWHKTEHGLARSSRRRRVTT